MKRNSKNQWSTYVVCLVTVILILLGVGLVRKVDAAKKEENVVTGGKITQEEGYIASGNKIKQKEITRTEVVTGMLSEKERAKEKVTPIDVIIDGVDYQIPFSVQKLIENGWKWDEEKEPFVSLSSYSIICFTKGDLQIDAWLMNPKMIDTTDLADVLIYSIRASPTVITLKDGSGMNDTWTKEMVKRYYGDPHLENGTTRGAIETLEQYGEEGYLYHYDEVTTGQIEYQYYAKCETDIYIDGKDYVSDIQVTSLYIDIEQALEDCYVKEDYYEKPSSLGSNLMSFTFKLDDKLYRLPVPIETLMNDGWELTEQDRVSYVGSKNTQELTITKDGKTLMLTIINDSDYNKRIIYCDVVSIMVNANTTASVQLPGKIKLGSKLTTLQKTYQKYESFKYTMNQVLWLKQQMYKKATKYACYEYYDFIPQVNGNMYHTYPDEYYTGYASFDVVSGKVVGITYGQYRTGTMGQIDVTAKENIVTVNTDKNAILYFNYAQNYSSWRCMDGHTITFYPNGFISAHYDGDEWFASDTNVPYTINACEKEIHVNNGVYIFTYRIVSSERVIFTFPDGKKMEFVTNYNF